MLVKVENMKIIRNLHKNLNKGRIYLKVFILFLAVMIVPAREATITRSAGMGLDTDLSWMVDDQYPFVFLNPAAMKGYENNIYFEYFNTVQMGGIFLPLMSGLSLGVFSGTTVDFQAFNSTDFQSMYHTSGSDPAGIDFNNLSGASTTYRPLAARIDNADANILENRNLEIILSYKMGRIQLGGALSYAFASESQSDATTTTSTGVTSSEEAGLFKSEFRLALGAILPVGGLIKELASSISFTKFTLDNYYTRKISTSTTENTARLESNGAFDIDLLNRVSLNFSRTHNIHAFFGYSLLNRSTRATDQIGTNDLQSDYDRNGHRIRAGLSDELNLSQRLGLFYGLELNYEIFSNDYQAVKRPTASNSEPYQTSVYQLKWPLVLGLNASVSENLDLRMGIRHNILNSGNNSESNTQRINNAGTVTSSTVSSRSSFLSSGSNISMGVSYTIDALRFDWLTNVNILKDGPYFISGKENAWSTAFAVIFNYGKYMR
ncbi:MAG: hypothetical protein KDK41_00740 [Leptospiraceae bacterium]|nr:hypothetical protein [Leptospiraceae bacterium]